MTAKTQEDVLKFHRINKKPTVFHLLLEIGQRVEQQKVIEKCALLLSNTAANSFDNLDPFGCCDFVDPIFIPDLKQSLMMYLMSQILWQVKPPAYPELGRRFDNLHPLMFGSRRVCEGIASLLPRKANLLYGKNTKDFAVVHLRKIDEADTETVRSAGWLVDKAKLAG
jgi:hypothetical protein